jgi:hypothetical protein
MANKKITQLPVATTPVASTDVLPVVQSGATKQAAISQLGFLPAGTGAVTATIQNKLRESVSVKDFGAVGDGVTDDTVAFQNFFAALSIGVISGAPRKTAGYMPAGVYLLSSNFSLTAPGYEGGFELFGDGELNTVLLFSTTSGTALSIAGNYFSLRSFSIDGTTARRAGSGNGLSINASLSTTSYGGYLSRINIKNHAGDGLLLTRVEQHTIDRIYVFGCGGRGIALTGGAGAASWNTFENCRAITTGGIGIELDTTTQHNTLTNVEALNFEGVAGIRCRGRSNVLINFDAENVANVTSGTSYTGVEVSGSRHAFIGGYIGDVNTGMSLTSATLCKIEQPTITNGTTGVLATNAISEDAASSGNVFFLPTSCINFTNVLNPATARVNDTLFQGSTVGVVGTWTPTLLFGGASTGITYSAQTGSYTRIGNLVIVEFDFTLSSKGSATGAATLSGLPIASDATNRSFANIAVLSGGSSITNLNASSTTLGTTNINIRSQGLTGFSDLTDTSFTATTRLAGSCIYRTA